MQRHELVVDTITELVGGPEGGRVLKRSGLGADPVRWKNAFVRTHSEGESRGDLTSVVVGVFSRGLTINETIATYYVQDFSVIPPLTYMLRRNPYKGDVTQIVSGSFMYPTRPPVEVQPETSLFAGKDYNPVSGSVIESMTHTIINASQCGVSPAGLDTL